MTLLQVEDLSIDYLVEGERRQVVTDVSFQVEPGEVLGIVGESGCGKTTLARSLIRLLPKAGRVASGSVIFEGRDILSMPTDEFRRLRWDRMSMVFQGAMNVLNPVFPVGRQIGEAIRTHRSDVSRSRAFEMAGELLASVGVERDRVR